MFKNIFLLPIRFYQRFISPYTPPHCRYYPTCSAYAYKAISVHGVIIGGFLGVWRILRCNPFSKGGVDFVPQKGQVLDYLLKKPKKSQSNSI